jgi:hypothetical protein
VPLGSPVLSRRSWAHRGKESKLISPSYSWTVDSECKLGNEDFYWEPTPGYSEIINVLWDTIAQKNGRQTDIPKTHSAEEVGQCHATKRIPKCTTSWTQWLGTFSMAQSVGQRIWNPTEATPRLFWIILFYVCRDLCWADIQRVLQTIWMIQFLN